MAPLGNGERIRIRHQRVAKLYGDGWIQQAIADELGCSITTVFNDLAVLERAGVVKKRGRGEAIAEGVSRYWQSEQGQAEAQRRSERLRAEVPVQRTCEYCGERFELSAAQAPHQPGRFCSRQCADAVRSEALSEDGALERLRDGRREWRAKVAKLKASGLRDLDGVLAALPRELRRSQAALSGHIAKGRLAPTPNDLKVLLFSDAAIADYIAWLRRHPDGRLQRFNATTAERATFRGKWHKARHKNNDEYGRQAHVGVKVGPKVKVRPDEAAMIREMRASGKQLKEIAHAVGVSFKQVRGVLARKGG